jgi:hypothetical protein
MEASQYLIILQTIITKSSNKNRHIDKWNKIEELEINPFSDSHLILGGFKKYQFEDSIPRWRLEGGSRKRAS